MGKLHSKWKHRWITNKAKSRDSTIDGLGVYATQNIKKGETVAVLGGVIVPKQDIREYQKKFGDVGIQVNKDFFIVPVSRKDLEETGVFNHSCSPNCGYSDSITLVAMKDIKKREELTFDYAFSETHAQSFKCRCGSKACRKVIRPTDWKKRGLQQKYGKYFSPYLRSKF